jgi:hypothetical protein
MLFMMLYLMICIRILWSDEIKFYLSHIVL